MSVGMILSWMVCGLIVGLIAHLLVRGGQHLGLLLTMVLGIVGSFVGPGFHRMARHWIAGREVQQTGQSRIRANVTSARGNAMMLRSNHPFVVAALLGGIVGATVAMMGGVRFREDLGLASSGDPAAQKLWTLDLFGLPTITGIHSQAGGFAYALLAFTVVGVIVAVVLTVLVRRRLYGAG
jgi:uncharacterized membrane protein YeaQ/YmgE (transglycosylase-associated protein family)